MGTFSKFNDIDAVLNKANDMLSKFEEEYSKCLREENIPEGLLVDIKDYLGNLRSALDYIWHKVPGVYDGYFPIVNSSANFLAKTANIDRQYSAILQKFQNYDQSSWIRCFSLFRNKNTHITLIPQTKQETREFSVKSPNGSATFRNCTFNTSVGSVAFGNIPLIIDTQSQFPINTPGLDIKRIVWVDFIFDGSSIALDFPQGISALPFLKKSLPSVLNIITELEKVL